MNVCIVGTGYEGLVTAACLAEMGNHIVCVDSNPAVIKALAAGSVHIFEPGLEPLVKRNLQEGRLQFTENLKEGLDHPYSKRVGYYDEDSWQPQMADRLTSAGICGGCTKPIPSRMPATR